MLKIYVRLFGTVFIFLVLVSGVFMISGHQPEVNAVTSDLWPALELIEVAKGLDMPTSITHANDDSGRLFILEQQGRIRIIRDGELLETPFLDIHERVSCCDERGLLGLAFPPQYLTKKYFYINYTDNNSDTIIARYHVGDDPNIADASSEEIVLRVEQPSHIHNGGQLAFGPIDGNLYIGVGDGGPFHDPDDAGQRTDTLLGKILRIDVESASFPYTYTIPADNPFVGLAGQRGEIWALGLRNPWRFSFDRLTGDLYIGDVGSAGFEEINFQPAASPGGLNYGWSITEGRRCHQAQTCDTTGLTMPVVDYHHDPGLYAVIGGYVYRGPSHPTMDDTYFYADYVAGKIWGLRRNEDKWISKLLLNPDLLTAVRISSFGEDQSGQIYVSGYEDGGIYRLSAPLPTPTPTATPTTTPSPSPTPTPSFEWPNPQLTLFAQGAERPVAITHAGDGSGRVFVVEQTGSIRIVENGQLLPAPYLDISDRVSCCGERGLLSLAFPPEFAQKNHFYVNYTDTEGNSVISRFRVSGDASNVVDPESEMKILTIAQPYENHNGGQLAFGPLDGYLYIGTGDGGSGGDPLNNGQTTNTLLGKILRIDVESEVEPYAIPATNPFVGIEGYREEIWALGLRNPWRFSFDRETGDLYIGDVGQNRYEEVNYQPASSSGGENYGWRIMEGNSCYNPQDCDSSELTLPVSVYPHSLGCSVTGGFVYRGQAFDRLYGMYFFGDYCQGRIWGLKYENGWHSAELNKAPFLISAFGEDEPGFLYVADYLTGSIYQIGEEQLLWLPILLR